MKLLDIIKDGTLVDNQPYSINQGILTNGRLGGNITLKTKSERQRIGIWRFLNSVSRDVDKALNDSITCLLYTSPSPRD